MAADQDRHGGEDVAARIDRWADIHAFQSSEHLGREVAKLGEIRDWLCERHNINGWCSCGHMERVHHGGGCVGLKGSDDDWTSCRCTAYEPAAWSQEAADSGSPFAEGDR